jgi:hypothetical protein
MAAARFLLTGDGGMMSGYRLLVVVLSSVALCAAFASSASAVEIGSRCTASGGDEGVRVQSVEVAGMPTYIAPSSGIVTKWGTVLPTGQSAFVRLKVVSRVGVSTTWSVLRESDPVGALSGENIFPVRIPISAGERIGVYSLTYAPYCTAGANPAETSSVEKFGPDTPIGGNFSINSNASGSRLAAFAVIEADADGDGYGDESQDLCPQRADMQTACPSMSITIVKSKPGRKSLKLSFSTGGQSSLALSGSVRVPAHDGRRAKTIRLKSLTATTDATGAANLTIKYPTSLSAALRKLPKRKKATVTLKLTATGLINTATKTMHLTLRGKKS